MATRTLKTSFTVGGADVVEVASFREEQTLGRPTEAWVTTRLGDYVDPEELVGAPAELSFASGDGPEHVFRGIVESVRVHGTSAVGVSPRIVDFRVVSRMALLDGDVGSAIYQELDVKEIVTQVLEQCGIPASQQDHQLTASYPKRTYCVRYEESALAFVSRLLEEEGIHYFAEPSADDETSEIIRFRDASSAAAPIEGEAEVPFRPRSGLEHTEDAIYAIVEESRVVSGKVTLRDSDFTRPKLDLTAEAEAADDADLALYDYPGGYTEPSEGARLARVRLEALQAERQTLRIEADCTRLHAGRKLTVTDALADDANGEHLVTSVVHELAQVDGRGTPVYIARARLLRLDVPYRAPIVTPRPRILGPQTAVCVAPAGAPPEEIHTDEHGRCKVKFHWDTAEATDDKASCWMRVEQPQTSGSMMLPRVGWEVVVEFLEGDPDRPIVTGRLYNGMYMPPYALPEGKTRTSIQTGSTPGGNGSNEIRIDDRAGSEEIMIRAQYDENIVVANNTTIHVGNNETKKVNVDTSLSVGVDQQIQVTKGFQTTVGSDRTMDVGANRTVKVNAVTGLNVGGNATITVGGNHFEMDGNPLKALLSLAAAAATEALEAKAAEAMKKIDAAVQAKVDQVMGPVKELQEKAQAIQENMSALAQGDLSAAPALLAAAGALPSAGGFAEALGGGGGEEGGRDEGGGDGEGGASHGGEHGGGEHGGGEDAGRDGEGGGEGEGEDAAGITAQLGIDQAVNHAIQHGVQAAENALGSALGLDSEDGGGSSAQNLAGPAGDVEGIDATDRAKGPGHALAKVAGSYSESVGAVKVTAAITGVMTNVAGAFTQNVGAAKIQMALGDIAQEIAADKTEKQLGLVVVSRADETESVGGSKTTMVGGAILEKIGGGHTIEAKAPAMFIGAFHKIEAATKITIKCGESEVVIDGSGVTMKSPIVTLTAGKIAFTKGVAEV